MSNDGQNEQQAWRRVEPTKGLLQGGEYVNAASTDIRKRFEAYRAAQVPPSPNVKAINTKRKA